MLVGSCAGGAAPGDDPEPFVAALYARYQADPGFFVAMSDAAVYSPSFMRVSAANAAFHARHADVSYDADPLCGCQEHDWMTKPQIVVRRTAPASAKATVTFVIEDIDVRSVVLTLVWTPAGWRVDDIGDPRIPSLRTWLIDDMQEPTGL